MRYKNEVYSVCSACIAIFLSGVHAGWPGPTFPFLLSDQYPFNVTIEDTSYIAIISPIGHIIGGVVTASSTNLLGRKSLILSLVIPEILSFVSFHFSYKSKILLYIGRFIGGIHEGASFVLVPTYIGEVSSPEIRGILGTVIMLYLVCGNFFINLLGYFVSLYYTALICLIFSVSFFLSFLYTVESPYYLLKKNRIEEAKASLKWLRNCSNIEEEFAKLHCDTEKQIIESGTFKELFTIQSNRHGFMIVILGRFFHQFTGIASILTYIDLLMKNFEITPVVGSSIFYVFQIIAVVVSLFLVDRFGRRILMISSTLCCSFVLIFLGIFFTIRDEFYINLDAISWVPLCMICVLVVSFYIGLGTVLPICISEILSVQAKAMGLSFSSIFFGLSLLTSIKFYQSTVEAFGQLVPFYSFGVITFVGFLFFLFCLPETKGKTLGDIQIDLNTKKSCII